jgi:pimeloyl-ACP methyl ester carboxylesterase
MPVFERETELGTVNISYLKRGKQGDVVFLIHGLGMGKDAWLFQMRPIAKEGFMVYAHDSRGFGKSSMTKFPDDEEKALEFYSLERDVEDLLALMDHLGVDKGHLVGISMGGLITQMFCVLHPERVISATIANSFSSQHGRLLYAAQSWQKAAEKMTFAEVFEIMLPWVIGEKMLENPVFETVMFQMKKIYVDVNDNWCFNTKIRAIKTLAPELLLDRIKEIKIPVLLIGGSDDILTPPKYQEYSKLSIPHAELVIIPDAGHASILDNSDAFNAAVTLFLKKHRIKKDK